MKRSATLTEPELTQICTLPRFDNSDIRETASRWRKPTPRQQWVLDHDSLQLVNTADQQRRGMPPYLLIVDLVFAAVGANCAVRRVAARGRSPQLLHSLMRSGPVHRHSTS
jgi:hypothetical protein